MLPVYDPKSFESVDLRKYHVRTVKDAIKFIEFATSRMEECAFVLKKFNTQYSTFQTVTQQLQKKLQEQQNSYGAPEPVPTEVKIQKVEEENIVDKEREALLAEVKQAITDENATPVDETQAYDTSRQVFEIDKYKIVNGKTRIMYYRTMEDGKKKLVSETDVPTDIKEMAIKHFSKDE